MAANVALKIRTNCAKCPNAEIPKIGSTRATNLSNMLVSIGARVESLYSFKKSGSDVDSLVRFVLFRYRVSQGKIEWNTKPKSKPTQASVRVEYYFLNLKIYLTLAYHTTVVWKISTYR